MKHDWKAEKSPTAQAIGNVEVKITNERIIAMQDKIVRLYDVRAQILGEISIKNTSDTNNNLQDAMNHINAAITEIEVYEQRLKSL